MFGIFFPFITINLIPGKKKMRSDNLALKERKKDIQKKPK